MHFGTTYNRKIAQMQHDKAWLLQTSHDCDSQSAPAAHLAMTATTRKSAVMFVCLGNICRSPTAEALFRQRLVELKLDSLCAVASCGTDADTGCDADDRTQVLMLSMRRLLLRMARSCWVLLLDRFASVSLCRPGTASESLLCAGSGSQDRQDRPIDAQFAAAADQVLHDVHAPCVHGTVLPSTCL